MSKLLKYFGMDMKTGDYLFKEGDPAESMYLIHSGSVKVFRVVKGEEEILQTLSEGEFVGEMAVINALPRSADAVALENSKLIRMDKKSFDKSIQSNNKLAVSFIQFLSKRLRDTNDLVKNLTTENISHKFFIEVLKEFIARGKRDQNKKWMLLNLNDFLITFKKRHPGDEDKFWSVMEDIIASGSITLKKDRNKNTWIGLKIS